MNDYVEKTIGFFTFDVLHKINYYHTKILNVELNYRAAGIPRITIQFAKNNF